MTTTPIIIPHTIFIIPYRDREQHRDAFLKYFEQVRQYNEWKEGECKVWFIHQKDKRRFNRGAMKNIGVLMVKHVYPHVYKSITVVFHDVDTIPSSPSFIPYKTREGVIAHYYGYEWCLGGIVAIKAGDFEKIKGYPNFWGWGLEDNTLQDRALKHSPPLTIDRSVYYKMEDFTNIQRHFDGYKRIMSKPEMYIYKYEEPDTMNDITNLITRFEPFTMNNNNEQDVYMVDVEQFQVSRMYEDNEFFEHDIRQGSKIGLRPGYFRRSWSLRI
jgi:hypothetical protein